MRRGLKVAALITIIAGLELATEGPSLIVRRIGSGVGAALEGVDPQLGHVRFVVGLAFTVIGVVALVLLAWSKFAAKEVTWVGPNCPQCGERTRRVRRKEWQRILSRLMGERITRRRCERCGWSGLSLGT